MVSRLMIVVGVILKFIREYMLVVMVRLKSMVVIVEMVM